MASRKRMKLVLIRSALLICTFNMFSLTNKDEKGTSFRIEHMFVISICIRIKGLRVRIHASQIS